MKIDSQDRAASVSIAPKEVGPDRSIRCSVKLVSHGFSGSNRAVWFSKGALETFATELQALEANRSGDVTLAAMSPEHFSLSLGVTDASGHTCCRVSISRRVADFGRWLTQQVSGEFTTDPSTLPPTQRAVASELLEYETQQST
jgi:hypothetical protein